MRARAHARLHPRAWPRPSSRALATLSAHCSPLPLPQVELSEDGLKQEESEFNPEFIARLLPKLDWSALRQVASELGIAELPERAPLRPEGDPAFLKSVHDLVMDVRGEWADGACARELRAFGV